MCDTSNENMPWDIQICNGDLKLVHRTQPMLGHGDYSFDQQVPAMSKKKKEQKTRFGLPTEKVKNFIGSLKPHPMHWRKIPAAEMYV